MAYTSLLTHIVFSTKDRYPFLGVAVRPRVHQYLGGIVRNLKGTAITIGGVSDHVHLLVELPPTVAISDAIRVIKSNSSGWIHDELHGLASFHWQKKYAAFSVSKSNLARVAKYIDGQEEHHRRPTFQDELRALLSRHGMAIERYLWL